MYLHLFENNRVGIEYEGVENKFYATQIIKSLGTSKTVISFTVKSIYALIFIIYISL